jgi:hypothetical protein
MKPMTYRSEFADIEVAVFKTRGEYLQPSALLRWAEAQGDHSLAVRSPGCVGSLDKRSRLLPVSSTAASLLQTVLTKS